MAQWQWRNDELTFVAFGDRQNAALEAAWTTYVAALHAATASVSPLVPGAGSTSAASRFTMNIGPQKYVIDLEHLTQENTKTGTKRFLRRLGPHGESTTAAPQWEWQAHSGSDFVPYDARDSEAIEKAFQTNQLTVKLNVSHGAHDDLPVVVHLGHMHQTNPETGTHRTIRRRVGLSVATGLVRAAPAVTAADVVPRKRGRETVAADAGHDHPPSGVALPATGATAAAGYAIPPGPPLPPASSGQYAPLSWERPATNFLRLFAHQPVAGAVPGTAGGSFPLKKLAIAGFDMDDTLVMPKSGNTFAKGRNDWTWLHPSVPEKLRQLHATGHAICIFSNQSGIGGKAWDEGKANELRGKILDLNAAAKCPISAFISCAEDTYRKPTPEMWLHAVKHFTAAGFDVDTGRSFYCGDAAGRHVLTMAGRKKDFSCSDRKFAYNAGVPFHTPETFFLGKAPVKEFDWDGVSPDELAACRTSKHPPASDVVETLAAKLPELVLFVGFPGCGKSTVFKRFFAPAGYVHVNRDTLKSKEKCLAAAESALRGGKSVVIDNTNPSVEDRAPYIAMAKKCGAKSIRYLHFDVPRSLANHLNIIRARLGITERVSSIAYNIFNKNFQPPSVAEGFTPTDKVTRLPLVVDFAGLPPETESYFNQLS